MNDKEKQVQIPFKTFVGLLTLTDDLIEGYDIELDKVKELNQALNKKFEAMEKRNLYTTYKTSQNEQEKEKARIEYLEKVGIHTDFRW